MNGLGSSNIRKVIEDEYGFIWFGTQEGITRFDGNQSIVLKKPQLDATDVSDLYYDARTKYLWIAYSQGGVSALNTITLKKVVSLGKYKSFSKISEVIIRSILVDDDDKLWVGTENGLFVLPNFNTDSIISVSFPKLSGKETGKIISITKDKFQNILVVASNFGVFSFPKGQTENCETFEFTSKSNNVYNAFYNQYRNILFLATEHGIWMYDSDRKILHPLTGKESNHNFFTQRTYCANYDPSGNIWISTDFGIFIVDKTTSEIKKLNNTEKINNIRNTALNIYFDKQNNIWITSLTGCYFSHFAESPFTKLTETTDNNPINHLYFLYPQEKYLLACDENGLYKYDYNNGKIEKCDSDKLYYLFFSDFKGTTFCSNQNGLFLWNSHYDKAEPLTNKFSEFFPYKSNVFCCCIKFGDSLIVLGSDDKSGIYMWYVNKKKVININKNSFPENLKSNNVNMLYKKNDHSFWILSDFHMQIFDLTTNKISDLTTHFKGVNYFFDIVSIGTKNYLASYGDGILEIDKDSTITKRFSTNSGLSNNCVYRVIPESDSILWATTNSGLNRINIITNKIKKFYKEDGLHSDEFEEFSATSFQGNILAGGPGGFTIIDPSKFTTNTTPPIFYFTYIKTETTLGTVDTSNIDIRSFKIKNNWLQTTVSFVGLNYSNPKGVTYQYRIKEIDTSWINNDTRNFVNIMGLSPGTYTLEVKAANEDGYWCTPKTLTLIFEPKWYQTWWFNTFIALAVTGLLYAFYRYRISQLNKQNQIRKEIATDLHDDIGSTLNSVKIYTHLAETVPDKQQYFDLIKESLKQASIGLRDMIWVLDDKHDNAEDLFVRLKQFASPVAEATGINLQFFIDDTVSKNSLAKTEKRNLLLIAKEAINNSIKYSDCKNIHVQFSKQSGKKVLMVRDDGKGFSDETITPGNGLKNMQERAKQIHYAITIDSVASGGTVITLHST